MADTEIRLRDHDRSPAKSGAALTHAPTAARRQGKPGREARPKSVTIDIHSHVAVPAAAKFVEPHLDWATIPLAHFANAETNLVGKNAATYRIWDGMRALDYLESRPDIIKSKYGCTGISGGGTLTEYLMALDERIFCAAPGCAP